MSKIVGYGYGTSSQSPYVRAGLGAAALSVPKGPYDLGQDGRIREVKAALARVGEYNQGKETLWRVLVDDDTWDDAAQDEYVIFLSRWMSRLGCYANPLMQFAMGAVHPTFTGLLLLDAAYRYAGGNLTTDIVNVFSLQGCATGSASSTFMPLLENFLTGQAASTAAVVLNRAGVEKISVTPTSNLTARPIPPPDVDPALYEQWTSVNDSIKQMWTSLTRATSDDARILSVTALQQARAQRDEIGRAIVAKAPPRTGTTDVENVGRCTDPQVWDEPTKQCITPIITASLGGATQMGVLVALAGAAWFFLGAGSKAKRSTSRRRY